MWPQHSFYSKRHYNPFKCSNLSTASKCSFMHIIFYNKNLIIAWVPIHKWQNFIPNNPSTNRSATSIGYSSLGVATFKFLNSTHIHNLPFFFKTWTIFDSHSTYLASLMKTARTNLSIASFTLRMTSGAILRGASWIGKPPSLISKWCSTSFILNPGSLG